MGTLSNMNDRQGGDNTSCALLKAQSSHIGGVMNYVQNRSKQCCVLRTIYCRKNKAHDFIIKDGIEVFLPMYHVHKLIDKKRKLVESLLPQLFFVYATINKVDSYIRNTPELLFNYYMTTFKREKMRKILLLL